MNRQAKATEKASLAGGHQPFTPDWTVEIVRMLELDNRPDIATGVDDRYLKAARR